MREGGMPRSPEIMTVSVNFWKIRGTAPGAEENRNQGGGTTERTQRRKPVWEETKSTIPGFSYHRHTAPMVLYSPEGTNTVDCRPIFIHDQSLQWEISPRYLAYCLSQVYDYDENIHVWINLAEGELTGEPKEKPKKPKKKKYKPVADRVHSVSATLPEEFRIVRHFPSDPLENMPPLNPHPGEFREGERYTKERADEMQINPDGFLWKEEEKLVHEVIRNHEMAFAWDETERGHFREDYFEPVKIPVLAHTPWQERNIPIPPGIRNEVVEIIRGKIRTGVYEPSSSSYRTNWFVVPKSNGALRLVHNLQPLNAVVVKDAGCPPIVEVYAESFGGCAIYGMFDLFVGFDHRLLDVASRDFTTFQGPFGTLRLTRLPQGYTNSVQIQQGDINFILQDEIPHLTQPFVDDTPVRGPTTYYLKEDGAFETTPENEGIRRFVWEHMVNINRILQRVRHAGGTFNAKKSFFAVPKIKVVGHVCSYEGRTPDESKVQKIKDWPPCEDLTDVRAFLGTLGLMRIFIKNFADHAIPLTRLLRKETPFTFGTDELQSMEDLKHLLINSPALRQIDYASGRRVILAVDSSWRGAGYILSQIGVDEVEYPSRFGSVTWNERESRYSQAKLELYGLFRALKAYRLYVVGVKDLLVRVDAKYIKGMLNNPDIQPNATINRWIAGILLFDFELEHTPGEKHTPDGLSRRRPAPEDPHEEDDTEEWIDRACGFAIQIMNWQRRRKSSLLETIAPADLLVNGRPFGTSTVCLHGRGKDSPRPRAQPPVSMFLNMIDRQPVEIPRTDKAKARDAELLLIRAFLEYKERPENMEQTEFERFVRRAAQYFILGEALWKRDTSMEHKLVLDPEKRPGILRQVHDELGHKGYFITRKRLLDRFWWPFMDQDLRWYLSTCHECQIRSTKRIHIPPVVAMPLPLFFKFHGDTMMLPKANGYRYLVQGRCSLSAWPEWRMLEEENSYSLGCFVFEEVLCRWGAVSEIVTDNGAAWVKAVEWLSKRYGINHIKISGYNSRANGIVERRHYDVREAISKACEGDLDLWTERIFYVFWAERVSIQKSTGYSPYYLAHGVEPLFPFDIVEATYMVNITGEKWTTEELIATRALQLMKRPEELAKLKTKVYEARVKSIRQWEKDNEKSIENYDFQPGALVLLRNSAIENEWSRKAKPRYTGPMVVIERKSDTSYTIAELNGAQGKMPVAAFRLIPYKPRSMIAIPITRFIEPKVPRKRKEKEPIWGDNGRRLFEGQSAEPGAADEINE